MTNLARLAGDRTLGQNTRVLHEAFERLATGKRINRASDNPAGLIVATGLSQEIRATEAKVKRLEIEDNRLAATDGAQSVVGDLLLEVQGLVVSASNEGGTTADERQAMQDQASAAVRAVDFLADTTVFNGEQILNGTRSNLLGRTARTTTNPDGTTTTVVYTLADIASGRLSLVDGDRALAQEVVDSAASSLNAARAGNGSRRREIESDLRQLTTNAENLSAVRSQIEDTDFAAETSKLVRAQVLQQAGIYTAKLADGIKAESALKLLASVPGVIG